MKNEDELARIHNEYGKLSGTEKALVTNGYMEDLVKPKPVINETELKERVTERIADITDTFELEDITEKDHAVWFELDYDVYKVKFRGGITAYRDVSRMGSGAHVYQFNVSGLIMIYNTDGVLVCTIHYIGTDFEAEFVYNEMSYFGCKESDF